jgi:cytochrome c-type biogenesis protein CcmF
VLLAAVALLLLAAVALAGTLAVPLSNLILGQAIVVGAPFYNNVLIPTGLLLLVTTAAAPLLKWGAPPGAGERRMLLLSGTVAVAAPVWAFALGVRNPVALAVAWSASFAGIALLGRFALDAARRHHGKPWLRLLTTLRDSRRQYAGFVVHLGFVLLAVGVTGSSLGTRRSELVMSEGQAVEWAGRRVRFVELTQQELPDKLVAQARLEVSDRGRAPETLLPAQHLHLLQDEWTTEVAIHSSWRGDLYTILHGGEEDGSVNLTLVATPLMRWIWLGGWVMGGGALVALWPAARRASPRSAESRCSAAEAAKRPVPAPHRKPRATRHDLARG